MQIHPIQKDTRIQSVREIVFTDIAAPLREKLTEDKYQKALSNSNKVSVFAITYVSNGPYEF